MSTDDLAERIMSYLDEYPRASDTAEGIAAFWVHARTTSVHRTLDSLVERGQLEMRDSGGRRRYGLASDSSMRLRAAAPLGEDEMHNAVDDEHSRKAG